MEPKGSLPYSQQLFLVPLLCKMNPADAIPSYSIGTYFNITLPFTPTSWNWTPPFRFRYQNRVYIYLLPIRAECPSISYLLRFLFNPIISGQEYKTAYLEANYKYSNINSQLDATITIY